ncbi:homing endonuclease associated repeat-containing protein [Sphingobacterium sp. NGMCC 1.201703]|uniref:homing endonuclease associated repeat-containing protein n=1 Tax=Sphingobacterium sp. NGMCC 1.201703 TaxID=3388657 RepID=UPI0039FC0B09
MRPTEEKTIQEAFSKVQEFYKQHGRTPIRREMENINTIGRRYFGSWNNFILAAGLKPRINKTAEEIKAELLVLLIDFYKKNDRIPMRREFSAKSTNVRKYFGTWNKFIAAAGFTPNDRRIPSIGKLKNSLVKFYIKHHRSPTITDCTHEKGLYNYRSYFTHFKVSTWADVLEYVGLDSYFRITTMTESEAKTKVIQLIKKHHIKHYKDYKRLKPENYPSVWYLVDKFGWNNLCYLAGTKIPVTKFSIKDYYLSLAKELGRTPTTKELEAKMGVTSGAMTWKTGQRLNHFIQSFGHKPAHSTPERCKLSKKQLADLYKRKSIEHGFENGMPRSKLFELTGYTRDIYDNRFHNINGLRVACGFKIIPAACKPYTAGELQNILKKPTYAKKR